MHARIVGFLGVCVSVWLVAATVQAQTTGSTARLGAGARALAFGEAFAAVASDATAAFWNPAGLATLQRPQFILGYRRLASSISIDSGSAAFRAWNQRPVVLGFSGSFLNRAGVAADNVLGGFEGLEGAYEMSGTVNVAASVRPGVHLGVTGGGVVSTLEDRTRRRAWNASAGILVEARGNRIGLALRGLTSAIEDDALSQPYLYRLSVGVARRLHPQLLLAVQFDRDRDADGIVAGGTEWEHQTGFALRAGARRGLTQIDGPATYSGGFGFHRAPLRADYALLAGPQRTPEHVLSFGVRFGNAPVDAIGDWKPQQPWSTRRDDATSAEPTPPTERAHGGAVEGENESRNTSGTQPHAPRAGSSTLALTPETPEEVARRVEPSTARQLPSPAESAVRVSQELAQTVQRLRARSEAAPPEATAPKPSRNVGPVASPESPEIPASRARPVEQFEPVPGEGGRFVVRAGVYADMDEAAVQAAKFYKAQLKPRLERRGELYLVVLRRCETRAEAERWLVRAREAGIVCNIDEE